MINEKMYVYYYNIIYYIIFLRHAETVVTMKSLFNNTLNTMSTLKV